MIYSFEDAFKGWLVGTFDQIDSENENPIETFAQLTRNKVDHKKLGALVDSTIPDATPKSISIPVDKQRVNRIIALSTVFPSLTLLRFCENATTFIAPSREDKYCEMTNRLLRATAFQIVENPGAPTDYTLLLSFHRQVQDHCHPDLRPSLYLMLLALTKEHHCGGTDLYNLVGGDIRCMIEERVINENNDLSFIVEYVGTLCRPLLEDGRLFDIILSEVRPKMLTSFVKPHLEDMTDLGKLLSTDYLHVDAILDQNYTNFDISRINLDSRSIYVRPPNNITIECKVSLSPIDHYTVSFGEGNPDELIKNLIMSPEFDDKSRRFA